MIEKLGGTKKRGEKLLSLEEFLPIYAQVKKDKEQGCYEDFIECLKLYDKNEDGTMLLAELNHALLALGMYFVDVICILYCLCHKKSRPHSIFFSLFNLFSGEALDNEQVETCFKDCMGEEDDDGNIKYARKFFVIAHYNNNHIFNGLSQSRSVQDHKFMFPFILS